MTTTLYLVRHGEVHNPEGVLYGRIPGYRLSEAGRAQAAAAADYLRALPLAALFASPQQRAQETAAFIAGAHPALAIQTDERLNEVLVPHEGQPHSAMEAIRWDIYTGNQPPYETPGEVLARVRDFVAMVRRDHRGRQVAAVTHGDIVVVSFLYAMRQPAEVIVERELMRHGLPERYPVTASVNILTFETDDADEVPAYRYHRPY
jgi:broad specificity phosphatase PhoE